MVSRFGPDAHLGHGDLVAAASHLAGNRAAHFQGQVENDERIEGGDVNDVSVVRVP